MGNLKRLFYSSFFSGIALGALGVILPLYLSERFNTSLTSMGLIFSAYSLFFALMQIPSSYIGDKFSRKKVIVLSSIIESLALLIYGFAKNTYYFVLGKGFEGLSQSLSRSPSNALLIDLSERDRFSESFGNLIGYYSIGYVIGFFIAGFLVSPLGYSESILILLLFQLISIFFVFSISDSRKPAEIKFNLSKFLSKPNRNLKILGITGFIVTFVEYMDYTVTVIFIRDKFSASIIQIGIIMGLSWLAFGLMQIVFGKYADRVGKKKLYFIGSFSAAILMLLIPHMSSIIYFLILFTMLYCLQGIAFPAVKGLIADSTSKKYRSQDFGLVTTLEQFGPFFGLPIMGFIADNMGFNAAYYVRSIVNILAVLIVMKFVKE